ncbi:40S ribosomal protein S20 [Thelohanellus kitauei]|uniref:40S ribosomal protein S20 n=1 Tax=Thelohanellus kitauei TaxID=669202 RepID=A0A0C2MIE6_THEKT|nr:40S ribosomal protein S20 [Thelohanellus kitauei]
MMEVEQAKPVQTFKDTDPNRLAINKVRLTLCGTHKVDNMNLMSAKILEEAKKLNLKIKGPIRLPVKKLGITTRKTPCGEGSKTWDHYRMEIHKWIFDLFCSSEDVKKVISFQLGTNVTIDVTATVAKKGKSQGPEAKDDMEVDESKLKDE